MSESKTIKDLAVDTFRAYTDLENDLSVLGALPETQALIIALSNSFDPHEFSPDFKFAGLAAKHLNIKARLETLYELGRNIFSQAFNIFHMEDFTDLKECEEYCGWIKQMIECVKGLSKIYVFPGKEGRRNMLRQALMMLHKYVLENLQRLKEAKENEA